MLAERGLAGKSGAVPSNQGPFSFRTVMKDVAREGYRACVRPKGGAGATEAGSRLITRAVVRCVASVQSLAGAIRQLYIRGAFLAGGSEPLPLSVVSSSSRGRELTMRRFLSWSIKTSSCGMIIDSRACSQKLIVAAAAWALRL